MSKIDSTTSSTVSAEKMNTARNAFTASPMSKTGGVYIAYSTLPVAWGNPLTRAMAQLSDSCKASPTRTQFGAALRLAYPCAFIRVGEHHVALHVDGENTPRDVVFAGTSADWL